MSTTPDLGVPEISAQQAQPEITHNEAVQILSALQNGVIDQGRNTAPGSPTVGDAYVVGASPSGAWAGRARSIAVYTTGGWRFCPDRDSAGSVITMGARHEGLRIWDRTLNGLYVWDGTAWQAFASLGSVGDMLGPASAVDGDFVLFDGATGKLAKDGGLSLDTDGAMGASSDSRIPSQQAVVEYVASQLDGRSWKQRVRAATTAAGTLATSFANGQTIDGVTLATGDRILIKDQAAGAENGIYTVNLVGAPTRATDADSGSELVDATVTVSEGAANAERQWTCSTDAPITVGVTALVWVDVTSNTAYTADESTLHLAGTQFSVKDDGVTYAKMQNVSATARVLGRKTAGAGDPEECTLSDILDFIGSAAQGDILYRGASGWARLGAGTAGQFLKTQGAGANPVWADEPFDVHAFYPGVPTASAKVLRIPVARAVAFPANFSGSYGKASANATGNTAFDVQKNGSTIGTITFAAGASTATFTTSGGAAQSLAAGDVLSIVAPGTADATLADVGFVLAGTR